MHKRLGFTVIEVALVMMVISVLLVVGVASMRSFQASSRDKEREADVQTFANYLERTYSQPIAPSGSLKGKAAGVYPAIASSGDGAGYFNRLLGDLDTKSLKYSGGVGLSFPAVQSSGSHCTVSKSCFNQTEPSLAVSNPNRVTTGKYIYFPTTQSGHVCSSITVDVAGQVAACRSFVIYYVLEGSPTVLQKVTSKRR